MPENQVSGIAAAEEALHWTVVVTALAAALFLGVLTALLLVTLMDRIGASVALSCPVVVTLARMVGYGLTRGKRAPDPSRGDPVC